MDSQSLSNEWFEIASMDLASAKYLRNMHPVPVEIICYHCQQAAEKMLKGVLISLNAEPPRSHDLVQLCKLCTQLDPDFEELSDTCVELTPYGVQARYPSDLELTEQDMDDAIRECKKLCTFVERHISNDEKSEDSSPES